MTVAVNLPFLNQAFHMDDGIYLLIARNVQHNPWFPQDTPVLFEGLYGSDLASTEHPWPLTSYLIALIAGGLGYSEVALHSGFLLIMLLLAWAMYQVSLGLTRHPLLATLTLVSLPVVAVMSHTLMTDIPLLALWLSAVAMFRRGLECESVPFLWGGAIFATLASLVSYSGVCVVVLLMFYAILRGRRAAALLVFFVPALVLTVLISANYIHYRRMTPAAIIASYFFARHVLSSRLLIEKSIFVILALGAVTVSPVFAIGCNRWRTTSALLGIAIAAGTLLPQTSNYSTVQKLLFVFFCWAGLCLLTRVFAWTFEAVRRGRGRSPAIHDDLFLGAWFLGVISFSVGAYMTGSARHLMPAVPALILIVVRWLDRSRPARAMLLAVLNLAVCAILTLALSLADFEFADIYRDFASQVSQSTPRGRPKTWFTGEWGFRAYLEARGARELGRRDASAQPGDLIVVPSLATPYATLYDEKLSLPSIALIAPSSAKFSVPPVPAGSAMLFTAGMPFHAASDGMRFNVRFVSAEGEFALLDEIVTTTAGRCWIVRELALPEAARKGGTIMLEAVVGGTNADADWIALARARIAVRTGKRESVLFDFARHVNEAQVMPRPGVQYRTNGNVPLVPMEVWLEQEPARKLCSRVDFRPRSRLRLLDAGSHAGFWSSSWGLLPFSFARRGEPLESISVYEVLRQVDDYGERKSSWYEE